MTLPLTGGYVERPVTIMVTMSGTLQCLIRDDSFSNCGIGEYTLHVQALDHHDTSCTSGGYRFASGLVLNGPGIPTSGASPSWAVTGLSGWDTAVDGPFPRNVVEAANAGCLSSSYDGIPSYLSGVYNFSYTAGPFRLGKLYRAIPRDTSPFPQHVQLDFEEIEGWFADDATLVHTSFGPSTAPVRYYLGGIVGTDPAPTAAALVSLPILSGAGNYVDGAYAAGSQDAKWTNLILQGQAVDTTGLALPLSTSGAGNIALVQKAAGSGNTSGGWSVGLPWKFLYDTRVSLNGGASAGATIRPSWLPPGETTIAEGVRQFIIPVNSWTVPIYTGQPLSFALDNAWMRAQTPPLDNGNRWNTDGTTTGDPVLDSAYDSQLYVWGAPARLSPGWGVYETVPAILPEPPSYTPVTISIYGVNVHRPDGNMPSQFVSSDASKMTVVENSTSTEFHVAATGATAVRTLVTNWHNYIDKPSGPADTSKLNWEMTGYQREKHNSGHDEYAAGLKPADQIVYPEDIYSLRSYGWMFLAVQATAPGTLVLGCTCSTLGVDDPHTTGFDRIDGMAFTQTPGAVTWTFQLSAGMNTLRVDLLFPDGAGPVQLGRLLTWSVSGLPVGVTTLSGMNAQPVDASYLKWADGPPLQREKGQPNPDYSIIVLAQDGARAYAPPDTMYKCTEQDGAGGGELYVEPITGSTSGIISDRQLGLPELLGNINRMEGIATVYNQSAYYTACRDLQFNIEGPQLAQWALPALPKVRGPYGLKCVPRSRQLTPVPAYNFRVTARLDLATGAEALCSTADHKRAGPGHTVQALDHTGAVRATAVTDISGYAYFDLLPANGNEDYTVVGL